MSMKRNVGNSVSGEAAVTATTTAKKMTKTEIKENKNMEKIWIVRERMEWHNCDADDDTTAYATEEMAKKALIEKYEETKRYLADEEEIDYERLSSDSGRIFTEREDYYFIWTEEIDMFNE